MVEQELRRELLEMVPNGLYQLNKSGKCVYVNSAGAQMTGYSAAEIIGQDLHALLHHHRLNGEIYLREVCPLVQAAQAGASLELDDILWNKEGEALSVSYQAKGVIEDGRVVWQLLSVSDRRRGGVDPVKVASLARKIAVAAASESPEAALKTALDEVMNGFSFEVGHCYFETSETGKVHLWRYASGVSSSEQDEMEVVRVGQEESASLIYQALNLQRVVTNGGGHEGEMRIRVAAPIVSGERPIGVMEFGSRQGAGRGGDLVEVLSGAGVQMGWVIEREAASRRLHEQEGRVREEIHSLEKINHENTMLREMSSLLDGCRDHEEILAVMGEFGAQLFPGYAGALALLDDAGGWLSVQANWGEEICKSHFALVDCWSLRRGRLHGVEVGGKLYCEHMLARGGKSICVPLYNRGEVLGLLSISAANGGEEADDLALKVAESLAVAMSNMQAQETLRDQKTFDSLTGLGNRRQMERILRREMERADQAKLPLSLLLMAVDDFNGLNKALGREFGDIALKTLSTSLTYQIRGRDILCRTGEEEFAIMFPETNQEAVQMRAKQIQERVAALRIGRAQEVRGVTVSMGLSFYQKGERAEEMLARATAELRANQAQSGVAERRER